MRGVQRPQLESLGLAEHLDGVDACRDERHEVLESIAFAAEDDDPKLAPGEILLQPKILISRHEGGQAGSFGLIEQSARPRMAAGHFQSRHGLAPTDTVGNAPRNRPRLGI
jgi:hypothetical protein